MKMTTEWMPQYSARQPPSSQTPRYVCKIDLILMYSYPYSDIYGALSHQIYFCLPDSIY